MEVSSVWWRRTRRRAIKILERWWWVESWGYNSQVRVSKTRVISHFLTHSVKFTLLILAPLPIYCRVCHTPGHTTDHIVLVAPDSGYMFSGDNVLGEGTAVFEDLYEYMKSLKHMVNLKPTKIFPGHGPVVEVCSFTSRLNCRDKRSLHTNCSFSAGLQNFRIQFKKFLSTLNIEMPEKLKLFQYSMKIQPNSILLWTSSRYCTRFVL